MARRVRRSSGVHGGTRQLGKTVAVVGILFIMVAIPLLLTGIGWLVPIAWLLIVWGLAAVMHGLLRVRIP
jgi:hypothetical protein